jgi:acyl-CoA dehydrogenase
MIQPGSYEYFRQERVIFGKKLAEALTEELAHHDAQRIFVVATRSLSRGTDVVQQLHALLGNRFAGLFDDVESHVPRASAVAAAAAARAASPDLLIAIGGGSALDTGKMVQLCLAEHVTEPRQLDAFRVRTDDSGNTTVPRRYLPEIAAGRLRLQAFGVTEPTTGSDTTKLKTRAVRDGDRYIINGQKVWTSRALQSDLMLLLARTTSVEQVKRRTEGLSVFLVDMREARKQGMEIRKLQTMINHQTTEIFFDNVPVPADALIGEENKGFRYILDGLNAERILVAAEAIGDAYFFIRKASRYANERVVFERPIGANQGVQFPIARAYAETRAADLMNRAAAALFDAGQPCGEEANLAKLLASEAAWHAADTAMQTHGGFGYTREYDVERKWRECRIFQIAPISTNLILSYLGQHVLGMPRSY